MDLAPVTQRGQVRPSKTKFRDSTSPRRQTDAPAIEVNAAIHRPRADGAEELTRILGLANDLAQNIGGQMIEKRNVKDAAQGQLDQQTGTQNEQLFKKSIAYHRA